MKYTWLFLLFFTFSFNLSSQIADAPNFKRGEKVEDLNAEQIIELNKPALVSIWYWGSFYSYYTYTTRDTMILSGSGFIFKENGLIGTNYHVIDEIDSILIKTSDGNLYNAEVILINDKNDLAIIRILDSGDQVFPIVKLGNSDYVRVGQEVFAIGNPLGYEYTISEGIVAGLRENEKLTFTNPVTYAPEERNFEKVIQITAAISPGNSGGALFNTKGEVIGITAYTYVGYGNLNFALSINNFIKFANSIDLSNLDINEETKRKRDESLYNTHLKIANNYKSNLEYNWYYSKQKDTMKVVDSFIVRQDSINRVNLYKAENLYNKCIGIFPDSFIVYKELMELYVFCERFEKAELLYKEIRERFESDSLLNLLSSSLARAYSISKNYEKALSFYYKMLKEDTTDIYIYYQVANIYEQMKDYKRAIKEYRKLIKRDSNYTQAYIQLGVIYYEKFKNLEKARFYLELANEIEIRNYGYSSYNLDLHYYLGMIAVNQGRKFDAILSYLELKNIYTYTTEDNEKKLKLYRAIKGMK